MANSLSLGMKLMSLTVLYLLLNFGFVEAENPLFLVGKPISNLLRLNRVGSDAAQQISSAAFSLRSSCRVVLDPRHKASCNVMAEVEGGKGPEGLKSIYESLSIGFQVNRALRIEHMMKPELGVEEVRGLG
jgi:hypothetical protein